MVVSNPAILLNPLSNDTTWKLWSSAKATQTLMSGKVTFDLGIGEAQCAWMLGTDQRKSDLVAAHPPATGDCLLQRILDGLLQG
jgi:hypothetical protein